MLSNKKPLSCQLQNWQISRKSTRVSSCIAKARWNCLELVRRVALHRGSILASHPASPSLNLGIPEIYQATHWTATIEWTHQVQSRGQQIQLGRTRTSKKLAKMELLDVTFKAEFIFWEKSRKVTMSQNWLAPKEPFSDQIFFWIFYLSQRTSRQH